jgi:hypothetical protein
MVRFCRVGPIGQVSLTITDFSPSVASQPRSEDHGPFCVEKQCHVTQLLRGSCIRGYDRRARVTRWPLPEREGIKDGECRSTWGTSAVHLRSCKLGVLEFCLGV